MVANPGPRALDDLSDDEIRQLTAVGAPPPAQEVAPTATPVATPPPASGIPLDQLSDDQLRQLTAVRGATQAGNVGYTESFGRGLVEGAMGGFDAATGVQDREARERSRAANPWAHFAGEVAGSVVPMAAATLLPTGVGQVAAAGRAAQLATRGAGLVRSALVPGEMNTALQALGQGSRIGAVYSAISGAGHADPSSTDSTTQSLINRAIGAGQGAIVGGVLGAPLGLAGYGASRLIGAAINRLTPNMAQVLEAATGVESQGVRDVMRQLGYDNYTMADLEALRTAMRDPANAHRFANLNLYEALETREPPQQVGRAPTSHPDWEAGLTDALAGRPQPPPELRQPVRVSPNVRDWAQDMANTGGQGRQDAVESFARRRQEMPGRIASDVDHFFGTSNESFENNVHRIFGSTPTNRGADKAALVAQREAFNRRFSRMRDNPLVLNEGLADMFHIPEFRKAVQYAAVNDMIQNPTSQWGRIWAANPQGVDFPIARSGITLSPANILDIHHALVVASRPPLGQMTSEALMAQTLKRNFATWVDRNLRGHKKLNEDYALFKRQMEATERGHDLSLNTDGPQHESMQFLGRLDTNLTRAQARAQTIQNRLDRGVERFDTGARRTEPRDIVTEVRANQAYQNNLLNIREEFAKSWGERIAQEINTATDPVGVIRKLLTGEGRARINTILGPDRGAEFTRYLYGQMIKEQIASAKTPAQINAIVREHLTQRGQREIMRVLGPEQGRTFIESLMNKATQAGLSETLFGNSNTAYKLARNQKSDALMDAVHGLFHMRPMQVLGGIREMGSAAYKQRRADQGNALLSRQGPEEVLPVVESVLARNQLRTSGHPYVMNPFVRPWIGPLAGTMPVMPAYLGYGRRRREP